MKGDCFIEPKNEDDCAGDCLGIPDDIDKILLSFLPIDPMEKFF